MTDDPSSRPRDPKARRAWRIAALGTLVLGVGLAALAAATGGSGRAGLAFFLLGTLAANAAAALYAMVTGAVDALRDRPVGRQRVVAAAVTGFVALMLPTTIIALGG